jgi:hypothetical protein
MKVPEKHKAGGAEKKRREKKRLSILNRYDMTNTLKLMVGLIGSDW